MPVKKRNELYNMFATGSKPSHDDFVDLIDSMINIAEDGLGISEKGQPMEIVQQGEKRRFLDFSSSKDTPIWRIGGQSADGKRSGLNIVANNTSRVFLLQDNGLTGINTDNPNAKLHIIPDSSTAFRVDDLTKNPALIVEANGSIGIGANTQESYKVTVGGKSQFQDQVSVAGLLVAANGLNVTGAKFTAQMGLTVQNGAIIENGLLEAKDGLTVSGKAFNANAGAIVSGLALEAKNGLTVYNGASIESGKLNAKAGMAVGGALLEVANGLSVQGKTVFQDDLSVENGAITAKGGISVTNNSILQADGQVKLGNPESGTVSIDGKLSANQGLIIANAELQAQAGAVINGAALKANNGFSVQNGAFIETGLLTAKGGISVTGGSTLTADGPVILGGPADNSVTINGALKAINGATISGAKLIAENGLQVTGALEAPNDSTFGKAAINNLTVNDMTVNGRFNLHSEAYFVDLEAVDANLINIIAKNQLSVEGSCQTSGNVTFGSSLIYATYQGSTTVLPRLFITKGAVTKGHFKITIDNDKQITIIYDETANIDLFFNDWAAYQKAQPEKTKGFYFTRLGPGSWTPQDMEISFSSNGIAYKEYTLDTLGLQIIYTGSVTGTPIFEIKANENNAAEQIEFTVDGLSLTVKYPATETNRTVNCLLAQWQAWQFNNPQSSADFEIHSIAGDKGDTLITEINCKLAPNPAGEILSKGIIKTNTVIMKGSLKFSDSPVCINAVSTSDSLAENSNTVLSTQKAIRTYIENIIASKAEQKNVDAALAVKADQKSVDSLAAAQTAITATLNEKADKQAVDAALAAKADQKSVDSLATAQTSITTTLNEKADKQAVDAALAAKADQNSVDSLATAQTSITTTLNEKADKQAVDAALAVKADQKSVDSLATAQTALTATLNEKADKQAVDAALAVKAEQRSVDSLVTAQSAITATLNEKADKQTVDAALAVKADQQSVDSLVTAQSSITATLNNKMDKSAVDAAVAVKADQKLVDTISATQATLTVTLNEKADKAAMTTALAAKADQTMVVTSLAAKAGLQVPNILAVEAGKTGAIPGMTLTTNSKGLLITAITVGTTTVIGLFGIHGIQLIKLTGDGMSDRQDTPNTYNIYSDAGNITVQNTAADNINVTVTYLGA